MTRDPAARAPLRVPLPWWRNHGFVLGLGGAVALAFLFPSPGARGGWLQPEILNNGGIALILFLQGLSLALEQIRSGAGNWRLHGLVQAYTFVVFPLAGLVLNAGTAVFWPGEPPSIRDGFLYLCVLPSTISTSVVLTAVARGNTAGALFNAALSNMVGVVVTPLLVHLLMQRSGQSGPFGPLLAKITLLTLVPFGVGMLLRPTLAAWIDARRAWATRLSNAVILFIVYSAFCDSVQDRVWVTHGLRLTLQVLGITVGLFVVMSALVFATCRGLRLGREDRIAAYFCAVKKTLAMGVPLAALIFGDRSDLPLILLPIMFYHPVQLLANGVLANHWARQADQRVPN